MVVRALPDFNKEAYRNKRTWEGSSHTLYFFNSGCAALKFFLMLFGEGKRVGVQDFTCITVKNAILQVNDIPVVLSADLQYFSTLYDEVCNNISRFDILILSHICGIPNPDYLKIKQICKENDVVLIDDLCQTFHAQINNVLLEDLSDNFFYSFFYDKPISATKGGALHVSKLFVKEVESKLSQYDKELNTVGRRRLHRLKLMSCLLLPEEYDKDFRLWTNWEIFILSFYPLAFPLFFLKLLLKPSFSKRISKYIKNIDNDETIKIMSDFQVNYIMNSFQYFTNNIDNLEEMLENIGIAFPKYLQTSNIKCSISKRALVPIEAATFFKDVELRLYNWPRLISSSNCNPFVNLWVNVPISTKWYKEKKYKRNE